MEGGEALLGGFPTNVVNTPHLPATAPLRLAEPLLTRLTAKRCPESGLCGVAAGLLEHRLQVRLRELQSIMVRLR